MFVFGVGLVGIFFDYFVGCGYGFGGRFNQI